VLRSANGLELLRCRLGESREGPSSALDLATLEATNLHTVSTMVVRAALATGEPGLSPAQRFRPGPKRMGATDRTDWN